MLFRDTWLLTSCIGSRDPYHIIGTGAGFDFRWDDNVAISVGHENNEEELIQLTSNTMLITIPEYVYNSLSVGLIKSQPKPIVIMREPHLLTYLSWAGILPQFKQMKLTGRYVLSSAMVSGGESG